MTAWDTFNPTAAPRRRLRGAEFAPQSGPSWREQVRAHAAAARAQAEAARARPGDRDETWGLRLGRFTVDPDALFALILFVPMLFIAQLGAMGAAAVAVGVPLYMFVRRERFLTVLGPRLFIFAIPFLCLVSAAWSEYPALTLRYAVQLGLTAMIGILLSSARNQQAVLRALSVAFFSYVAVSLAFGGTTAMGLTGQAFSGLGESKNVVADIASTGAIISLAVLFMAIRARNVTWICFAALTIPLDIYAVLAARSAGALLGLGMGVCALLGLTVLLYAGKVVRAWLTSVLAVLLIAVGLSFRWLVETMIQIGATVFDKDPTLTGRTYLWYRAADLIQEKPVLGRGYFAFWVQGNIDAEGLWRYFGIDTRGGFTFHNTAVEILVTLGWLGLFVIVTTVLIATVMLIRRFVRAPTLALVCWVSLFLYILARTPIESLGLVPFYFSTALAFAALGAAFGRVNAPPAAAPVARAPRQPLIVRAWSVQDAPAQWANGRSRPESGSLRLRAPAARARR